MSGFRPRPFLVASIVLCAIAASGCTGGTAAPQSSSVPSCGFEASTPPSDASFEGIDYDPASAIGQRESEVAAAVEAAGGTVRVVERDGVCQAGTDDYRSTRLNIRVSDGLVTWAQFA